LDLPNITIRQQRTGKAGMMGGNWCIC